MSFTINYLQKNGEKYSRHRRQTSTGTDDDYDNQSDDDTNFTPEDSTLGGSSYKSGRSAASEPEVSLLEHVDNAMTLMASSLGGLLGVPETKGRAPRPADQGEDKSVMTEDDYTYGQSTMPSEYTGESNTSDGDWLGYMVSMLSATYCEQTLCSYIVLTSHFALLYSPQEKMLFPSAKKKEANASISAVTVSIYSIQH